MTAIVPQVQVSSSGWCDIHSVDPATGDSVLAMSGPAPVVLDFLVAATAVLAEKVHPPPTEYEDLF